ncbi:hypothetical protein AB870_17660 [Pandoraea faecigallinarum]|uniref:Uncharacterized protein n=1 Tax=Pandoraea faecigallinarum TaxID=656179 RepID=A0A0H3WY20_9BURK|nr:hypothetical protein [Pandoraea faecigallinarum]AKM31553.1 hypothetical protein AB870_17660 [Pandoraea faecigallinarum]
MPAAPSSAIAPGAWRADFSGIFTLSVPPDTSVSVAPHTAGKRDFAAAFGEARAGEDEAANVARWKRLSALREIPVLEPKPSTSGVMDRTAVSVPDNVLRSALLTLGDPRAQAPDWFATLESRALDAVLEKGAYAEAHRLLEGLLRRLEAEPSHAHWTTAFERVVALVLRFESRTALAARSMLLTSDKTSGDAARALARASTNASIEHLIGHRLHAIADMPGEQRATAWRALLDSMCRSTVCTTAGRLAPLARFIGLLASDEQMAAATAVVEASCAFAPHGGWRELTSLLLGAVPVNDLAPIARAIASPGRRLYGDDMKEIVETVSGCIDRMPEREARLLVAHLTEIVMMRGDFDYLTFAPDECAQLIDDLRSACRRCGFDDLAGELDGTLAEVCDEYKATMID